MPDVLDGNGLTVKTLQELLSDLTTGFQGIYGSDINIDQNSPDGQLLNLIAQAAVDIRELAVAVNANFDPDQAQGSILDQRVVINNIERKGATYTIQPIDFVTDRTVIIAGLDENSNSLTGTGYTVQDNAGNQFILLETEEFTAGSYTRNFRAAAIGLVEVTLNTITIPNTIVLGVSSITNSEAPDSIGENEESDAELKIRRQASTANASSGYINSLQGNVLALDGVLFCKLYENFTNATDANGIPAHCIWLIVDGGTDSDIGNMIYAKKDPGCNMKGTETFAITTPSGGTFTAAFDRPSPENLYIKFNMQGTVLVPSIEVTGIKNYIAENLIFDIGAFADTSRVTAVALAAQNATGSGAVPVDVMISLDGATYVDYLAVSALNKQWAVSTARIAVTIL